VISLFRSCIDTDAALSNLREVLDSGWLGLGKVTDQFEEEFGHLVGAKHVVATSSCTAALHLAVKALDLPRGSQVLTTPITFISTNAVLLYEGLVPVFCDVNRMTGNLSVNSVAHGLEIFHPKAIIAVHLGGYPCEMVGINTLARVAGIPVVEDCAHALGAQEYGQPVGAGDNLCCWSFHAVKNLPVGNGGAVSTQDPELAARLRRLRWHGIDKSTAARTSGNGYESRYEIGELGLKAEMNDVAAAIGLAQIPKLEEHNKRRAAIAAQYAHGINGILPEYRVELLSAFHFFPMFFKRRDIVARACAAAGIATGMHYRRNDRYPMFADCPKVGNLAGAQWYEMHELTLPLHAALTDEEVDRVIDVVNRAVE